MFGALSAVKHSDSDTRRVTRTHTLTVLSLCPHVINVGKCLLTLGPAMAGNSARSIRAYSARAELGRICKVACCIIYAERPSQRMEE